ncbi:DUF4430 domain-containing protein [Streptococcus hillyeri]|uniref:DUF4430 domain-containing protein n=1 Tax=Streptococcus hillyeri TaxID=2282420 RepID=A0A3L9DQM4_9STRE|nr:DUF4430 domain-containing protein [Streptococcus hillyeri]RLY01402.1 DUF4430 domain-containing protein [Streptococcus hillyeri]
MKKLLSSLVLLLSLFLVACGNGGADKDDQVAGKVQLIVNLDTNKMDEQVTFEKGDTVMDVLEDNYEVEEDNGMITAIDGIAQDETKGIYWMFKVNDDMAPKGAEQITLNDGDKIEFYQEKFE